MRWLFIALALAAAGGAAYLFRATSSFTSYSGAQLDTLEQAYQHYQAKSDEDGANAIDSYRLLRFERTRRWAAPACAVLALLLAAGAFKVPRRWSSAEAARLSAHLAKEDLDGAARKRAAETLGVQSNAPPALIEAALKAQLDALLEKAGAPPELLAQRKNDLLKARDLLLRPRA